MSQKALPMDRLWTACSTARSTLRMESSMLKRLPSIFLVQRTPAAAEVPTRAIDSIPSSIKKRTSLILTTNIAQVRKRGREKKNWQKKVRLGCSNPASAKMEWRVPMRIKMDDIRCLKTRPYLANAFSPFLFIFFLLFACV